VSATKKARRTKASTAVGPTETRTLGQGDIGTPLSWAQKKAMAALFCAGSMGQRLRPATGEALVSRGLAFRVVGGATFVLTPKGRAFDLGLSGKATS
jgi:hypothetical protein